ncbi:MAG: MFS transporter [Alphaproteobacteria bacterium]|nr:MFS transporter [Alphaproteobacteria bacterium]
MTDDDGGVLTDQANSGWRAVIGSSAVLSLALLGDALIYAVLPAYAEDFGLTLPWVGVMLSANRFVRVFAYGVIARMTYAIGVRRMCVGAAVVATISTALYGFGQGPATILIARISWGLSYAALLLVTLAYAVEYRSQVGVRVGVGRAIQRVGPIVALFIGAWLVGFVGPTTAFLILAVPTALAIPVALTLPQYHTAKTQRDKPASLARPRPIDILFFLQGYGVDGVFAISITLIFAREASLSVAVMSGGALLAMRHLGEAVAAPLFGWISDRFGARRIFIGSAVLTIVGFIGVAAGLTVFGALVMLLFRGAMASLGPAVIVQAMSADEQAIGPLARMQAWRDLGAACGPLATGFLLAYVSAEMQHAAVAFVLVIGLIYWLQNKAR